MRMQWLAEQLRGTNGELDELALNLTDPSGLLPSPALSVNRWKPVSVTESAVYTLWGNI